MNTVPNVQWQTIVLALITLGVSSQSLFPSFKNYHHEIIHPAGQIQGSLHYDGNPVSLTAGFHLKSPPPPPFSFLPSRIRLPTIEDFFQQRDAGNAFLQRPPVTAASLFTPNTVQQPAETTGQVEMYRKALEEEAREAEKQQNDFTTRFEVEGLSEAATDGPTSFVQVSVNGAKDYNYNYAV